MTSEQMYAEVILDYYRNPRNFGTLKDANATYRDVNPACGDVAEMFLKVKNGVIDDIKHTGRGCAISLAASGMLTELVKGKTIDFARSISKQDMLDALGIPVSIARLKCALLGLKVFKCALYHHMGVHYEDVEQQS